MRSKYPIILCSQSPRRSDLLKALGLEFTIEVFHSEEIINRDLVFTEWPVDIAVQKLKMGIQKYPTDKILIAADTMVFYKGKQYGKPKSLDDAYETLKLLSGKTHEVITGVAIYSDDVVRRISSSTKVKFSNFSDAEIRFYLERFHPLDKAGSYGIQDWIGLAHVESLRGSYENVIGLPTARVYEIMKNEGLITIV